jgi:hypothetical protein
MSDPFSKLESIEFNAADLWREEIYTDRATGSIRVMIPVTRDGQLDLGRKSEYYCQTQVMTNAGALPVEGPIEAATLSEAIQNFGKATKLALQDMLERMREYQREQATQIITPGQAMGGGLGGSPMGGLGGAPRSSKGPISLR